MLLSDLFNNWILNVKYVVENVTPLLHIYSIATNKILAMVCKSLNNLTSITAVTF